MEEGVDDPNSRLYGIVLNTKERVGALNDFFRAVRKLLDV